MRFDLIFVCLFHLSIYSQENVFNFKESDVILSNDLVTFRAISAPCYDSVYKRKTNDVFLEVINKTNKKIEINFIQKLYYDGDCLTCDDLDISYRLMLGPHKSLKGTCLEATNFKSLRLKGCYKTVNGFQFLTGYKIKLLNSKIIN